MSVKSLHELNLEFQREQMNALKDVQNAAITELTEPPPIEISVKPLDELNLEFQIQIQAQTQTLTDNLTETSFSNFSNTEEPETHLSDILPENTENTEYTENTEHIAHIKHIEQLKQSERQNGSKKKNRSLFGLISDILFYTALFIVMLSVLTSGSKDGAPRMFMGYSYFTVLTSSMQDEIPRGSFILVRETDPQELNAGDNITYMRDASTTVTHKIIDIYENYQNSGARGFQTKGVNNINPDKDIVYEANVVGKVILVLPRVGAIISSLKENIYIVFIIFGLCVALSFLLRRLFVESSKGNPENSGKYGKNSKKYV